jgi:hypothetical protein
VSLLRTPTDGMKYILSIITDIATGTRDFEVMSNNFKITYVEGAERAQSVLRLG